MKNDLVSDILKNLDEYKERKENKISILLFFILSRE